MKISPLGLGVLAAGIVLCVAALVASDRALSNDNATPTTTTAAGMPGMSGGGTASATMKGVSFAGAAPANAKELAAAHVPYPAELPPVPSGDVVKVHMVLKDVTIEIAPGVKYAAWGFEGGAPGPVVHARQGQTVEMTLTNKGAIPHSIDFHAARIAPNLAFVDVAPGESFTFKFKADDPGVYMYHCGTKPVLMHIANGMYGAIVVDPKVPLPKADRSYVLVASEWYMTTDGLTAPASFDQAKARAMMPDWTTFNGYAGQYVAHPLPADPGDLVRFYVVDAGPSLTTAFHVVGTILEHRLRGRRHEPRARAERRADGGRPGRRGRRVRRADRPGRALPVREPLLRERRHGPGRPSQGREPSGDHVTLGPVARAFPRTTGRRASGRDLPLLPGWRLSPRHAAVLRPAPPGFGCRGRRACFGRRALPRRGSGSGCAGARPACEATLSRLAPHVGTRGDRDPSPRLGGGSRQPGRARRRPPRRGRGRRVRRVHGAVHPRGGTCRLRGVRGRGRAGPADAVRRVPGRRARRHRAGDRRGARQPAPPWGDRATARAPLRAYGRASRNS